MKKAEPFPLLREFARGYLHQDLIPEYGDPLGAAKAYLADLGTNERKALAAESQKILPTIQQGNAAELNRRLHEMGSAWNFVSRDEFEQVLRLFDRGQ